MIEIGGAEICAETFGDPGDPAILLLMGIGGSMLWWDEELCRELAAAGRFVIRYDHRDTGRSTAYEPGHPGYTGADLTRDATRVLDGLGIEAAHLVGMSAGAGIAQEVALSEPDQVRSLVLISTSPAVTGGPASLPPPTARFGEFLATATVDWSDPDSIVEYLVGYSRLLAGGERDFDEDAWRDLARREVERARDSASAQNHDVLEHDQVTTKGLSEIDAPTLIFHGSADPMFPPAHGEAVAEVIPDASLTVLEGAGHGVFREDWDTLVPAIVEHTARTD